MSAENSIILITNNQQAEEILKPKLILLREIDTIMSSKYSDAINSIKTRCPDLVILYCQKDETQSCLDLIKQIKSDETIAIVSILLVCDDYDQDFILNAYDENISDYFLIKADDAEILMRTIWCLKKNSLLKTVKKQHSLLEDLKVINTETGFYANKACDKVFNNELKILNESELEGILMAVSPSEQSKTTLSELIFAKAIKKSTRNSDVIAHGPLNKFYILLPKTPIKGAFCVWDKIKNALGEDYAILAGVSEIHNKTFEELKSSLLNALVEAQNTQKDLVVADIEEEKPQDWLEKINSTQKNFKLFKQAFTKKLDKVITPVFFQVQKLYEEKLFDTTIEQFSNSTLSSFSLKNSKNQSELKITYPGFSKINIDIIHQGLDSPENKRISLDLTELEETKLTKILEDFIQEFKSTDK